MSKTEFSSFFPQNFATLPGVNALPFDFGAWLETGRRNMEAITEAQTLAITGIQAAAQRQGEIISRLVQDNSEIARELMTESSPERKVAKQADLVKHSYEQAVAAFRELSDIVSEANHEAADVITKRISASLGEIKTALEKTEDAAVAAAPRKKAA